MSPTIFVIVIFVVVLTGIACVYYRLSDRRITSRVNVDLNSLSNDALTTQLKEYRKIASDKSKHKITRHHAEDMIAILEHKIQERQKVL